MPIFSTYAPPSVKERSHQIDTHIHRFTPTSRSSVRRRRLPTISVRRRRRRTVAVRPPRRPTSSSVTLPPHRLLKNLIMQLANNAIHQTHYDVLDVKEDASQEEIRASYRSALLSSHPDKLHNTNSDHNEPEVRFLEIQTAWEILGDVKSRALYDRELQVSRQDEATADEVELEDMTVDASGEVVELFYQCRCGDYFSLDSSELKEMGFQLSMEGNKISLQAPDNAPVASIILPCGSCSLKIRLVISKDTQP